MAFAYSKTGDNSKLIAQLGDAIKAKPDDGELYMRRGAAYMTSNDFDKAVADFTQSSDLLLNDPRPHVRQRAVAYIKKQQWDKATRGLRYARRAQPEG